MFIAFFTTILNSFLYTPREINKILSIKIPYFINPWILLTLFVGINFTSRFFIIIYTPLGIKVGWGIEMLLIYTFKPGFNFLFILVGLRGLLLLERPVVSGGISVIYLVLFSGILLTGFGSAWYHLSPDNDSLVFDRLPMTIVFMALLSATIGEQIDPGMGVRLLFPLLVIGVASILWWHYTERAGAGDLRLYVLVQYYPILLIPLILLLFPSPASAL